MRGTRVAVTEYSSTREDVASPRGDGSEQDPQDSVVSAE